MAATTPQVSHLIPLRPSTVNALEPQPSQETGGGSVGAPVHVSPYRPLGERLRALLGRLDIPQVARRSVQLGAETGSCHGGSLPLDPDGLLTRC
jgi:hypothetical protein